MIRDPDGYIYLSDQAREHLSVLFMLRDKATLQARKLRPRPWWAALLRLDWPEQDLARAWQALARDTNTVCFYGEHVADSLAKEARP